MAKKVNKTTFTFGGVALTLTKSKTKAAVRYTPEARELLSKKSSKRGVVAPPLLEGFEMIQSKGGIDTKLDQLRARTDVALGSHVWQVDENDENPLIPTGTLYIEFVPDTDVLQQQALLEDLGLGIKERVGPFALRAVVSHLSPNPIKCVVLLQKQKKLVRIAEPEFVTLPATRNFTAPSGTFLNTQWHLENTGAQIPIVDMPNAVFGTNHFKAGADAKVKAAWKAMQSIGSKNIKIAVIDTGFAPEHPQLRGDGTKLRGTYNAANRSTDVSPFVRYSDGSLGVASHGTSCAAVAAGAWDSQGILGAAPNARLLLIKLDILSDDAIRNAFEYAALNGADIISCSLGFPQPIPLSTYLSNYLSQTIVNGRGGRGLPVFFAAGNANPASNNVPRAVSDFAAHPAAFCITASNSLDQHSSYSFYGPNAFLCAPTNGNDGVGITTATCDIGADQRSVALGYTSGFGGTSSATPLVAGICALMLSINPDLRLADIRNILAQSADKIGPNGSYGTAGRSQYFGYGRVNAFKAVQMAAAMAGTGQGVPAPAPAQGLQGRVVSPTLNVRKGPASTYQKVAEFKKGDVISLIEKTGSWWRIGADRYVSADYIEIVSPPPSGQQQNWGSNTGAPVSSQGKVISPTLNVRSGPGTNFQKMAELKMGALVSVYERNSAGWYRIGDSRWVLGKYVQVL